MVNKLLIWYLMKRLALVASDDAGRRPFLASLPSHVRKVKEVQMVDHIRRGICGNSMRGFLMTYCACFAAVAMFIA